MNVTNSEGRTFLVRVVHKGDRYGLDDKLTHDKADPMVEFYDLSYPDKFGPRGQFVSRYNAFTLSKVQGGLNLCGHEPVWSIDAEAMLPVVDLAKRIRVW